jgi:predicted nuclease with TOPRIM domain
MLNAMLDDQARKREVIKVLSEDNARLQAVSEAKDQELEQLRRANARLQEAVDSQAEELTKLRKKARASRVHIMTYDHIIRTATQGLQEALYRLSQEIPKKSPPPPPPK